MSSTSARLESDLRRAGFRGALLRDEPLARYTTWRIGGPADLLATPRDVDDLRTALGWTARTDVAWRVLGNGSNLLIREDGVRGIVLRVRKVLDAVEVHGPLVVVGAGASFPAVANLAAGAGLAGLEFGAGIPGTVGGALVMNAGWHEFEIGKVVDSVDWMDPGGRRLELSREACGFAYRHSALRERRGIVLSARMRLRREDPGLVRRRMEEFSASRKENQPTELPSCGSVFLKPEGDFAGRLIDAAGLKGLRVGDVEVSRKHANFFVNTGRAKASDVLALVERVEREVERRFGVRLRREFEVW